MTKEVIDLNTWKRNWQYNVFFSKSNPYLGVTSPIKLENLVEFSRETKLSFYSLMSYFVMKTINSIDEFKYVLEDNKIYKYDNINMNFTVLNNEGQLRFSPNVIYSNDILIFLERFFEAKKLGEDNKGINTDIENNLAYLSCTPWMRLTSVINPHDDKNKDSIPRICFGKYFDTRDGYYIDVAIEVNHAFQDGYHLGLFYNGLEKNIANLDFSYQGSENSLKRVLKEEFPGRK